MHASMRFEDVLEHCIVKVRESELSPDDCLAIYPDHRESLEPLLNLAVRLQAAQSLTAPAEFRQVALARMNNLIAARPRPAAVTVASLRSGQNRRVSQSLAWLFRRYNLALTVTVILFCSLILSGIAYASGDSLPGEIFYSAKLSIENVRLSLSFTGQGDTSLRLIYATRRLEEASRLLDTQRVDVFAPVLGNYNLQIEAALAILANQDFITNPAQSDLAVSVIGQLDQNEARLNELMERAPAFHADSIRMALETSRNGRNWLLFVMHGVPGQPTVLPLVLPSQTLQPGVTPRPSPTASEWPTPYPTDPAWWQDYPDPEEATDSSWWDGDGTSEPGNPDETPVWATRWPNAWPTVTGKPTPLRTPRPRQRPTGWPTDQAWPTYWPTEDPDATEAP